MYPIFDPPLMLYCKRKEGETMDDRGIFGGDPVNDIVLFSVLGDEEDNGGGGGGSPSGCSGGKNWVIAGIVIFIIYILLGGGR